MRALRCQRGSAPVEFILVGALLAVLTTAILQLGVAFYVRNVAIDAAIEGASRAALADGTLAEGEAATRTILTRAIGAAYAQDVQAERTQAAGVPSVAVIVRAPLPLVGLFGLPDLMEVVGIAPAETLTLP